jgi:Tfp pilus assembly protein PilN
MIRINMLREGRGAKKPGGGGPRIAAPTPAEGGPPWGIFITILLLVVLALVAYGGWLMWNNHKLAIAIAEKQEELKKYEGAREKVGELEKKKLEYTQKVDQIKQLKDQQSVPVKLMNRLVEVLPDGAWYTTVAQGQDGKSIIVEGRAKGIKTISTFYDNLVATPEFGEVQLGDVRQDSGIDEVYSYKLTFNYYPGGVRPKAEEPKPAAAAPRPKKAPAKEESAGE